VSIANTKNATASSSNGLHNIKILRWRLFMITVPSAA
jgi:hypothetical protein